MNTTKRQDKPTQDQHMRELLQDKTRQDETIKWHDKAIQDKTRQDNTTT